MSTEENKALVRRFYEEIDKGNIAAMDELVAEGYINHAPPPFPGFAEVLLAMELAGGVAGPAVRMELAKATTTSLGLPTG
jgi:hypothetical protein